MYPQPAQELTIKPQKKVGHAEYYLFSEFMMKARRCMEL
jgi:hypothetical protein